MSHTTRRSAALVARLAALALLAPDAAAQSADRTTRVQIEQFEPLHSQQLNILNVQGSEVLGDRNFAAGLFFHYEDDPLELIDTAGGDRSVRRLVQGQLRADLTLAVGMGEVFELAATLPFVLYQHGDDLGFLGRPGHEVDGFALGDLRLIPKIMILDPEDYGGFGLAAAAVIYIHTGDGGTFNSDGSPRLMPQLVADWRHDIGVKVALNLGYLIRARRFMHNVVSDDQLKMALGVEAPTGFDPLRVQASLFTAIQTRSDRKSDDLSLSSSDFRNTPVELDAGVRYDPIPDLHLTAGAGLGLTGAVGAPDFRVFLGFDWSPSDADTDGDGILDEEDQCVDEPEDVDEWQDSDGCPDADNDDDGVEDADDRCPNDPEDVDGFEDIDGCPDPDNDSDGKPDTEDTCPMEPEDVDAFEDDDGCPDPDNDGDGLADGDDECPVNPEDMDRFEDDDGCPDPDNDQDGVLDDDDVCPNRPETINDIDDEDGCPDREGEEPQTIEERGESEEGTDAQR